MFSDISDHLPVFSILSEKRNFVEREVWTTYREKTASNMERFRIELQQRNLLENVSEINEPCLAYSTFLEMVTSIYNSCFPIKKVKTKKRPLKKPWITKGLLKSIKKKNVLFKRFLCYPSPPREHLYKRFRNKLNHLLKIAKRTYYDQKLKEYQSNAKYTWRILNEVVNRRKHNSNRLPSTFKVVDSEISDPVQIANGFCDYFTNLGPALAEKVPPSSKTFTSFLEHDIVNSVFFESTDHHEITNICKGLRPGTAAGFDNIHMDIVSNTIDLISKPLSHIINLSITSGVVPNELKIARVIPLFKSGDQSLYVNYRPVSVLPIFSKFLEKVIYNRLYDYLTKYHILFDNQYGFRKQHSTALALIHLYDKLSTAIDNKEYTMGVFIDLSKAFDTVNHDILLAKLKHYGIRGISLKWFESYLSGRMQYVNFNGYSSCYKQVKCGVPQGSILGPLLFLIYINDLCNVSNALDLLLFADDTSIFFSNKNLESLSFTVNNELNKLTEWFFANKLSINIKKSNYMVFRPRQKRQTPDIKVALNNHDLTRVKETVFLGVVLDEHLTWIPHITNVARKISKSVGIMYKASFCLSKNSLATLYYSLVYPYLQYCVSVW